MAWYNVRETTLDAVHIIWGEMDLPARSHPAHTKWVNRYHVVGENGFR